MHNRFGRRTAFLVAILIVISLGLVEADAQTRKKRRARRVAKPVITNPVITPPTEQTATGDRIISTADENTAEADLTAETVKSKKTRSTAKPVSPDQEMQETINALSTQVDRLTNKLTQMQENDRSLLDMERLTRAEQRAESLRSQQLDVESKLADIQAKLEQIEYSLKPENIDRLTSTYGTTRPEEAREARKRQLEGERSRLQAQVRILETSRTRLETAVANADAEVDLLRRRLQQQDNANSQAEPRPAGSQKPE